MSWSNGHFNRRRDILAGVVAALVVAHVGSGWAQTAPGLVKSMTQAGTAKVAIAATPPYAYLAPSGEAQGYLIEVSNEILKSLGVPKLQAIMTTWDAMIPGLQAKQYDFLPGGMNITAARCQVVAFTVPVTAQQDALYVKPGNPRKLEGYASVAQSPGVQVAVLAGSSQENFALKRQIPPGQLVRVPDIQAGIAAVTGGRADAFIVGQFSVTEPGKKGVEVIVDKTSPPVGIALAFRKEDAPTRDAFDARINAMKADGTLKKLYADKYGFNNWELLARTNKASAIAAASILGCAIASIALAVARRSTLVPLRVSAGFVIEFLRGASVLIYLFWVYYALPLIPGMPRLSPLAVSIVVLSLVGGAYGAEIVVSGLQAVPRGQPEAAHALGLSKVQTFIGIVLPQALTQIVPAFASLAIDMVKWTAIVSFLGVQDLLSVANTIRTITYSTVGVYLGVALIYLALCLCTSHLFRLLEQVLPLNRALAAARINGRTGQSATLVVASRVPQP